MFSNIILGLTILTYSAILFVNLNRTEGTGDQMVGYSYILFIIAAAYAVLSLILTIIISLNGGFNWISSSSLYRNIGVFVLWLGMIAGVIICTLTKADISFGNKLTGIERLLALLIYNGGIWLPLLMLLPYASLLNPEWRYVLSPNLVKIPLLLACTIGLITFVMQIKLRTFIAANTDEYYFNKSMTKVNEAQSIKQLFSMDMNTNDKQLRQAIYTKIKSHKNLEDELIEVLKENNPYVFISVYDFLDSNEIDNPERFIESIKLNLDKINSKFQESMETPWEREGDFESINIGVLCKALNKHFKESSDQFRPYILAIQKTLDATPKQRDETHKDFMASLIKYRLDVKNWLDLNSTSK
ncbi:MAG: hypothetical protein ABI851_12900 [Saprospiraceae bacterium]